MSAIPEEITLAVEGAVRDASQDVDVARKLTAWLTALMTGSESLTDSESVRRRLDVLFESVRVPDSVRED